MKKILSIVGRAVLTGALVFGLAACQKNGNAGGGGEKALTPGQRPYSDGSVTLTVFLNGGTDVVSDFSYEKNLWTKSVVDATGIKLDITSVTNTSAVERVNVMLSANTYPEVIIHGLNMNDMNFYASQGILQPMDEEAILRWPNIKAAFEEFPAVYQKVRGVDGKIYALPDVNDCLHCVYSQGRVWYNMPFVRDHGFSEPQTTDELVEFLRYVVSHDMNKNGKKDEIGIAFDKTAIRNFFAYFSKPFLPWAMGSYYGVALEGKTVVAQYRDPRFREALKWMAGMYKEGLIAPDSFTMSNEQMQALWQSPDRAVAVLACAWMNGYATQPSVPWIETFNLPALRGPGGQRNAGNQEPWSILYGKVFMTDKLKTPELLYALYDYMQEFDVMVSGYIGPKGTAWNSPDPGTSSLSGGTPLYKLLITYGSQPLNASWDQAEPMIRSSKFRLGEQATNTKEAAEWLETGNPAMRDLLLPDNSYAEQMWYRTSLENSKYAMPAELFIPPIGLQDADNQRYSDINAVVGPYLDKAFTEFVTGIRDISSDAAWNAYLTELDQMNAPELISILQKYIK
jgi:putative aldouronate transport system substrate-binding protein